MLKNKKFSVIVLLFFSPYAFAYLDPGSGSALISVIITTIGSFWHSIKSIFYRLFKGKQKTTKGSGENHSVVLFSEGKNYWGTFKPILDELINRKIYFSYFTLDLHDPALQIESAYMKSKRLSANSFGYSKIESLSSKLMIATSPNIGTKGYPISKPNKVKNLIHVFHHIGDISSYKKYSLDNYDSVFLAGNFQIKSIRELEIQRGLKEKQLIAIGLPYLDQLLEEQPQKRINNKTDNVTILIASSWGNKGCLNVYGIDFINKLAAIGYHIIIRPHPHSLKAEPNRVRIWQEETLQKNIEWDFEPSPTNSMAKSDLLISDTSAIRFDYAFLYKKPVITLHIDLGQSDEFEAGDLNAQWHQNASYQIGQVINKQEVDTLTDLVPDLLRRGYDSKIDEFMKSTILNIGSSAHKIVDYIENEATEDV